MLRFKDVRVGFYNVRLYELSGQVIFGLSKFIDTKKGQFKGSITHGFQPLFINTNNVRNWIKMLFLLVMCL